MPLLSDPSADAIAQAACTMLGRALYFASGFEDDCRALAFILKVQEAKPREQSDDDFFAAVSRAVLGKLFELNELIANRAKLKEDYLTSLHAAREARNYIAHEATSDFERLIKIPEGFGQWKSALASKLAEVALGKIIVAVLLSRYSKEETPSRQVINAYPKLIESWVFEGDAKPSAQPGLAHIVAKGQLP